MGNSCSSGQAHKDKDASSQKSEESASYKITCKKPSIPNQKQLQLLNNVSDNGTKTGQQHSGVILEPSAVGQQLQKPEAGPTKALKSAALSSVSDSLSLSSPLGVPSPRDFDKLYESTLPAEIHSLPETSQNLLLGRINQVKATFKTKKIVIYVSAADSQDCCVEKGTLHNLVYPKLRKYCREHGYELHIVDLHWKTFLEKQQDHEFPELCLGELTRQLEVAYVIPVLFINNSLGTPLLPITMESTDFELAVLNADESSKNLLSKWYQLDKEAQPPCYRLQAIGSHIPGFKQTSLEEREKALEEWQSEIERILAILVNVLPQELRDTYLTTVVEQEVHNTVLMSQELAKRCIWINRVYTPAPKTPDNATAGEMELVRRLNSLQKDLKNQLNEKHIVRLPVKYVAGGLCLDLPEHSQYVAQVESHLEKHLTETISGIMEEHHAKSAVKPTNGIDARLFDELNQQTTYCQKAAQCSVNRETVLDDIKTYVTGDKAKPLVIFGPGGCGKSTLVAKVVQSCQQWLADPFLIFRFVGLSAASSTVERLLSSITNQCSILTFGHRCFADHNVETYAKVLPDILAASCLQRPLVILIDGIDQVRPYGTTSTDWLPQVLPDNIKLILSVAEGTEMHAEMLRKLPTDCFVEMPLLGRAEAKEVLMSSVMQYNHSVNSRAQDCVLRSVEECTLPLYAKVLAWQTSWWADKDHDIVPRGKVDTQLAQMLEELETILGVVRVQRALALIMAAKYGVADSEMVDLMAFDETFHSQSTYVVWAPACLDWSRLTKHLAPFLQWVLTEDSLVVQWKDNLLLQAVKQRYTDHNAWAHRMLIDYYEGKWCREKPENLVARLTSQDISFKECYNQRKLEELPYQHHQLNPSTFPASKYLNDPDWFYSKICGLNTSQLLEDIVLSRDQRTDHTRIIKEFLETSTYALDYDGRQFYTLLESYLEGLLRKNDLKTDVQKLLEACREPPVTCLLALRCQSQAIGEDDKKVKIDQIARLPGTDDYVVSVATEKEELCVWDVKRCRKARTLQGVTHPIDLVPITKHRCIVLCRRELHIYDLDSGAFVTKLKGVMNQKMPYFGLHDHSHLVALSRNRMYVNLMNLDTGDCVTTFKAGEDRFLNSLLVSGNGKILVCGDETQKPFPLLVWNLQSKKLLYDLRIPHHDFITSLSAITSEGSYVCCVCHEIDEPAPNFIVVYDLQSGTLFKKWKPSCNTVSLEISSQGGCVISGHEDARILVWDLITGNCRWSLCGHNAPVTCLRLDPTGGICLSYDAMNRDRSLRLWDLHKGNLLAVYTPPSKITCCELTSNGNFVVLATEGAEGLSTLQLRGPGVSPSPLEPEDYGDAANEGKTFQLKGAENC